MRFVYDGQISGDLPGITLMPEALWGRATRWLTVITVDPQAFGADREAIRVALEDANIESRPLWKPMHLQPVFQAVKSWAAAWPRRCSGMGCVCPRARR